MIRKLTIALLFLATATSLLADPASNARRRTIILKNGKVLSSDGDLFRRVYLGFSPLDVSPELREYLGASKEGVVVQSVKENGPAAKAGLKVGDVVTAVDGKPVESAWTMGDVLDDKKAGDTVRLDVIRNRQHQTLVVTLEERDVPKMPMIDIPGLENIPMGPGLPRVWHARVEASDNCGDLQSKIKDLESRLRELEKKLPK
jgi:membrane-associated protease RseP (regulator of RpoE activity)